MLTLRKYETQSYIYLKGDYADEMYFIAKGSVMFVDERIVFRVMRDGSYFGESEMMDHIPRCFTTKTSKAVEVLVMKKAVF
jgi:CRP-like cAMP-binding protein